MMSVSTRSTPFRHLFFAALLLALPAAAYGQARSTMSKQADITVFGAFTRSTPDYGREHNTGLTVGADYTRYFKYIVAPSLEVRFGDDHGRTVNEKVLLAGLRLKGDVGRFHPYGDGLIGGSFLTFVIPPYPTDTHDQGLCFSVGGGLDVDVYRNWAVKFDFQHEHTTYSDPVNPIELTPTKLSVGVVYRIPFGRLGGHGTER